MDPSRAPYPAYAAYFVYLGISLLLLLTLEGAFRFGCQQAKHFTQNGISALRDLQGALLTLVSLLLAFVVSMADVRFETRKQILSDEGNAFGTMLLRKALLPDPVQKVCGELLASNLKVRIDFYEAPLGDAQAAIQKETDAVQSALWALVADSARKNPTSTTLPLVVQTLNETLDIQGKQQRAYENHLPESLMSLLFFASALVVASMGFLCGIEKTRHSFYTSALALLIAATLFVIIDLDRPRGGLIRIHPDNLVHLLRTLPPPGR